MRLNLGENPGWMIAETLRHAGHDMATVRDREDSTMEPRRVPVDWEELKLALEVRADEWASSLDVRTGEVRASRIDSPLDSSVEYDWMDHFADAVPDAKDALADYPRHREQWFAFRDERLREAVRDWLADNDIEPTTTPPRRPIDRPGDAR